MARATFGQAHIVVHNAGIHTLASIMDFPLDRCDLIMPVNMSSAWHLTRRTLTETRARRWVRMINIASAHVLVAAPFECAYVMAKHAEVGLAKTLALGLVQHGVACRWPAGS